MSADQDGKADIYIVAGPTASGKSAYALDLAQRLNGVIINCDSMQIYDALPLLAAQPSAEDNALVPHALYGALHPNAPCSAGLWRRMAIPVIEEALAAGQTPIICGGTGFYIKALTEGLSPIPDVPETVRAQAMQRFEAIGCSALYDELIAKDPLMKGRFHPNHSARILRAWEIFEATGKSLAYWQDQPLIAPPENWQFHIEKILPDRDVLYDRCNRRFDLMLEQGALEEVKGFNQRVKDENINPDALITKALGYAPLSAYLSGDVDLETAVEQSKQDTRRYAKRQMTWLRNQI